MKIRRSQNKKVIRKTTPVAHPLLKPFPVFFSSEIHRQSDETSLVEDVRSKSVEHFVKLKIRHSENNGHEKN